MSLQAVSEVTGRIGEQGQEVGTEIHKHREPPALQSEAAYAGLWWPGSRDRRGETVWKRAPVCERARPKHTLFIYGFILPSQSDEQAARIFVAISERKA